LVFGVGVLRRCSASVFCVVPDMAFAAKAIDALVFSSKGRSPSTIAVDRGRRRHTGRGVSPGGPQR
jgi:hypothetical protein